MAGKRLPTARIVSWLREARAALRCERGQTLLEYALIVGFIGIGSVAAMIVLGPAIGHAFEAVTGILEEHMPL